MYLFNRKRRRNSKKGKNHPLLSDLAESKKRILEKRLPKSAFKSASYGGKQNRRKTPRESKADL